MTGGVIVSGKYLLITTFDPSICLYSNSITDLHVISVTAIFLNERCFHQAVLITDFKCFSLLLPVNAWAKQYKKLKLASKYYQSKKYWKICTSAKLNYLDLAGTYIFIKFQYLSDIQYKITNIIFCLPMT